MQLIREDLKLSSDAAVRTPLVANMNTSFAKTCIHKHTLVEKGTSITLLYNILHTIIFNIIHGSAFMKKDGHICLNIHL